MASGNPLLNAVNRIGLVPQIIIGLMLGVLVGTISPKAGMNVGLLGELFVGALKAVAPVLVFVLVTAALVLVTPSAATSHYIVLMLSVILGFHVISNVTPALHTPLMSVTNAISGIILVGAISQVGHPHPLISAISLAAVVLATINIVGGFAVTHRMLAMFTKD